MAFLRIRPWLVTCLLIITTTTTLRAQRYLPFVDLDYFSTDSQFFAAADIDGYGGGPSASTGWFASFDRMYMYVSRPNAEASNTQGDMTWGNRIDLGYMTEEKHGWLISMQNISGPNSMQRIRQERNNRFMEDASPQDEAIDPPQDNNNRESGARDYFLEDSLNMANLSNFEINKTFLMKPLHNGAIVEPFYGFRYMRFTDFDRQDDYTRYDEDGAVVPIIPIGPPPAVQPSDAAFEEYISGQGTYENNLVGGQLGFRYSQHRSRWLLSGEVRAFAFTNLQNLHLTDFRTVTEVDVGTGNEPDSEQSKVVHTYMSGNEFVFGGEIRAEAAYEVTRDISLRFGMEFLDLAQGIGRGRNPEQNDEDVQLFGLTFGFTVNR